MLLLVNEHYVGYYLVIILEVASVGTGRKFKVRVPSVLT